MKKAKTYELYRERDGRVVYIAGSYSSAADARRAAGERNRKDAAFIKQGMPKMKYRVKK